MDSVRQKLVDEARSWVGVRYRHKGRSKKGGIDCIGLIVRCANAAFNDKRDYFDYLEWPPIRQAYHVFSRYADRISQDEAGPGDVVMMCFNRYPVHFGILTDRGVIHATSVRKIVVEHSITDALRHQIAAYYRLKGIKPCHLGLH